MTSGASPSPEARRWIARAFRLLEDVVYIGLALLLAAIVLTLLVSSFIECGQSLMNGSLATSSISLLDRILLILLIVEVLYTVQVSFREHALVPEPFLLVGLISSIRRVLILTAEFGKLHDKSESAIHNVIIELGVLTVLILALAISLMLLRKKGAPVEAKRS
jgi:uncharacterized membrane protein (DUF373 family)